MVRKRSHEVSIYRQSMKTYCSLRLSYRFLNYNLKIVQRVVVSDCKIPFFCSSSGSSKCTLACVTAGGNGYFFGHVKDGTRCENNPNVFDVCIGGQCKVCTTISSLFNVYLKLFECTLQKHLVTRHS